jgi:ubiquinone/menaquinone biosynthesis C-methylase UbiE
MSKVEEKVQRFYEGQGWETDDSGVSRDAQLWEDLRDCASKYVSACRLRIKEYLPATGDLLLDAASGTIQYIEYLEYSHGFKKRVCVDISQKALDQAQKKLGNHGEYIRSSILDLPFPDKHFDAVVSLHTIYHIAAEEQEHAVLQLIRVIKPGKHVVIVYSNPDRLLARLRRMFTGKSRPQSVNTDALYFFAYPLSWWTRFSDQCVVEIYPWRSLTASDSRRFIPDNAFGKLIFRFVLALERHFPKQAVKFGAYPVIVLTRTTKE